SRDDEPSAGGQALDDDPLVDQAAVAHESMRDVGMRGEEMGESTQPISPDGKWVVAQGADERLARGRRSGRSRSPAAAAAVIITNAPSAHGGLHHRYEWRSAA